MILVLLQVSRWWPAKVMSSETSSPPSVGCIWVVWLGGCSRPKVQLKKDCVHPFLEHFNEHFNADLDNSHYKRAVRDGLDAVQSDSQVQHNPIFDDSGQVSGPPPPPTWGPPKSAAAFFDKENIENLLA